MHSACRAATVFGLLALLASGCSQNTYGVGNNPTDANKLLAEQQQELEVVRRTAELERKAATLDTDNQELQTLLAQSQQRTKLLKDEVTVVRGELKRATDLITSMQQENQGLQRKTEALTAMNSTVTRRAGASIRANNSLLNRLTVIQIPNVQVRQDGDVIRVELPESELFSPGAAQLMPSASPFLDSVMADVLRAYPDQVLGIEGHTDSDPVRTQAFPSNYHLSVARATAVLDHVTRRFQTAPRQLFLVGHGGNHPIASNATLDGKRRNRRIELVVYPEAYR